MNDLISQSEGGVSNFIQSKFWKSKVKDKVGIHIPMLVYSDSFQVNNSLGPHSEAGKLDGVYVVIPALPPNLVSLVDYIILVLYFKTIDRDLFSNAAIFQKLIDEINDLQTKGIIINVDGSEHLVHFHLAHVIGDNLGMNGIFDFVSCFTANFCCRFCKIHKDNLHFSCVENLDLLRNKNNYLEDVLMNDPSATGIVMNSIWNDVSDFHVTQNPSVDVMHDFFKVFAIMTWLILLRILLRKVSFL